MSYLILDADFICYTVACVFQETYILATHPSIPETVKLKNKTELWGKAPKREGGFVQEYNELNFASLKPDEFTFTEHQEALPLERAKKSVDTRLQGLLQETGASSYVGFVGRGELDRVQMSTLWKYKGQRELVGMRPIHLSALKQYMVDEHNCIFIEGAESDDAVSEAGLNAYTKWKATGKESDKGIITFADKDLCQVDSWQYHVGQCSKPELRVGFGKIARDEKGKVRGWGRLHLYWQVMGQDASDNFSAACFSDVKHGDIAAFNLLSECTNDKQAFEALVKGYKKLYPEPKVVVGWRGDEIKIDWLYVLQECFDLAKMLRKKDEQPTNVKALLTKLQISF
jgi:hypothetical protein